MLALRIIIFILVYSLYTTAETVFVSDINELAVYAAQDDNNIRVKPGIYQMSDYLTEELIEKKHSAAIEQAAVGIGLRRGDGHIGDVAMFEFSGSNNNFDFTDVTIEVDTKLLSAFDNCYVREFLVSGNGNTFSGLTLTGIGDDPTFTGGNNLSINGDDNTFLDITLNVRGSSPYGYGDLLGKGARSIVSMHKHGGVLISGTNTTFIRCSVFMRSFGHAFFIQGGINTVFENCYAKGELRSTDDMLAETSGLAFENDFEAVYPNLQEERKIPSGYMKSLAECGFRTYSSGGPDNRATGKVTLINCVAENMRVGFALHANEQTEHIYIDNCEAISCERGFFIDKGIIKRSRSDAKYGPMIYLIGSEPSQIELTLTEADSEYNNHALATISGAGHKIVFNQAENRTFKRKLPILVGWGTPTYGSISAPIPQARARDIKLINNTQMPIEIGKKTVEIEIVTNAAVKRIQGKNIKIEKR